MSGQGFDTWILEVRGAGLSAHRVEFGEGKKPTFRFVKPDLFCC